MSKDKAYTIVVTRTREVEVIATSFQKAKGYVKDMYISGDACAELEDATFAVGSIRELTAEESGE